MRTYSKKLALEVLERDHWCIYCGSPHNLTIAHVVNKGMGGTKHKDLANNLVCLCIKCHDKCDNGSDGYIIRDYCKGYLNGLEITL